MLKHGTDSVIMLKFKKSCNKCTQQKQHVGGFAEEQEKRRQIIHTDCFSLQ